MNSANTIRYLAYQATRCRDRDSCEALVLLVPSLLKALDLRPMSDLDADEIRHYEFDFSQTLRRRVEMENMRRDLRTLEVVGK